MTSGRSIAIGRGALKGLRVREEWAFRPQGMAGRSPEPGVRSAGMSHFHAKMRENCPVGVFCGVIAANFRLEFVAPALLKDLKEILR